MSSTADMALLQAAADVAKNAYAPYSSFRVGAALLADDGRVFTGCNVENASYGLAICAERAAIATAVAAGVRRFSRIAIVASGESRPYPCGACRQVLAEFCDGALAVLVAPLDQLQANEVLRLDELLPHTFTLGEQDRQGAASAGDTDT